MAKTLETVRFTGERNALYCRERAVVLHKSARLVVPDNYVAFVIADGRLSKPLVGAAGVFSDSGIAFDASEETTAVDFIFVSCNARFETQWQVDTECANGEFVYARGTVELCASDHAVLAEAIAASPDDDIEPRLRKRMNYEIAQAVKTEGDMNNMLARIKSAVCAVAAREFGLLPTRFDAAKHAVRRGKEIDDEAKFCSECGAALVGGAKFCKNCGKKIDR